jgi:hypothetical protein
MEKLEIYFFPLSSGFFDFFFRKKGYVPVCTSPQVNPALNFLAPLYAAPNFLGM